MTTLPQDASGLADLLTNLRELIQQGRQRALRAVDMVQVQTCWEIGRHIVEFEQQGQARAAYGKKLLPRLAADLTREFGKGFDERNLRNMRGFFQQFPIWNAVRTELSWTHYRTLLRVDSEQLFATKFRLILSTEDELRRKIECEDDAINAARRQEESE